MAGYGELAYGEGPYGENGEGGAEPALAIASMRQVGTRCVEITFNIFVRVNAQLFEPSNYAFDVRLGYAQEMYVKTVTPEVATIGALTSKITVCCRDHFSKGGRYDLRITNLTDEFDRPAEIGVVE